MLIKTRGRTANYGLATIRAAAAEVAEAHLYEAYVRLWRARQAEELRRWKLEQIYKSPAATARLRFLERQDELRVAGSYRARKAVAA